MTKQELPNGITSFDPIPYGYRRWNGAVWANAWTDSYNSQLSRIKGLHDAGYDVQSEIGMLYGMSNQFDRLGKERKE